jgi:predicted DNA binding protein
MSVVTEVKVPSKEFKLEQVLSVDDSPRIEIERVIPMGEGFAPLLWIKNIDVQRATRIISHDEDVEQAEIVDQTGDSILVSVKWTKPVGTFFDALIAGDASCLRGVAYNTTWHFTLRFQSRDDLATFYRECTSQDVSLTVGSIHNSTTTGNGHTLGSLSDQQYETLCAAFEAGYFSIPRETTLQELADQFGISDTATSQRIRRGLQQILETELAM